MNWPIQVHYNYIEFSYCYLEMDAVMPFEM